MQLLFNTIMLEINRWTEHHNITVPLINLLESLHSAEFNALEIWQYHISSLSMEQVQQLKEKMDLLNMSSPVVGAYVSLHLSGIEEEDMDKLIDDMIAKATVLGASTFKIKPGSQSSSEVDLSTWELSVNRIKKLTSKLASNGMKLSMETHSFSLCDSENSTIRLMNDLSDVQNVGICYQPFDDQDTDQAIQSYSRMYPYIIHIHLQNLPDGNAETTTFLETGNWIDYTRLLPYIKKSGFDGVFSLEFTEGIFPPKGEKFDPQTVINNAIKDRDFFLKYFK